MGQVYRARQPSLDRMVALKVLPRSVAANRDAVSRFYREAKNAAGLVHPNIVQIYTVGEERGVPYFAMEFVEGEDLEKRLESGKPLSTDDVVGIVASVAMALACAEEHGIVHRDIKPGNVMIDRHGVVKVTDFGLAKAVKFFETEITQAGFVVGTPTYMSPEQGTGKEVDNRADIYSLGVVFYELLCGRPPFQSEDPATLIYKHVHEPPVPPWEIRKEVPEEVARLCLKCLAKKPEDRYQSAAELLTDAYNVQEARLSAVSALSAGAQASAASAEGQAVQPPGDSAIVFDRRMAKLVMSSGVAPKPKAAAARLRVMGWLRSHWPVAAAAAGGVLVVAAALVILLGRGSRPDAGRPAEAGLTAPPGEQVQVHRAAADAGRSVLPLSNLNKTLAAGLCVEVRIGENPPLRLAAGSLKDLHVDPGPVAVAIFREHYEKLKIDMAMTQEGPSTDLRGVTYVPKPDEKLGGLLADATRAIDEERFQDARQALGAIRGMDPEAAFLGDIEASLAAASDRWDSRLSGVFEEGERLRRAGDLGGAASCFKGIPPGHRRYADARSLLDLIVAETQKVDRNIAEAETRLHRGDLAAARAAYSMLTGTLRVPAERLADLAERIETAEGLLSEADDADARQDHAVMRARLRSLAEVCPDSEAVARRLARV